MFLCTRVTMMGLQAHHCREVIRQDGPATIFCGEPKKAGKAWCAMHCAKNLRRLVKYSKLKAGEKNRKPKEKIPVLLIRQR